MEENCGERAKNRILVWPCLWTGSLVEDGAKREGRKRIEERKEWDWGGEKPRRQIPRPTQPPPPPATSLSASSFSAFPAAVRPFQPEPVHKLDFAIHLDRGCHRCERQSRAGDTQSRWPYSPREEKKKIYTCLWTHLDEVVMWLIMPSNPIVSHLKNTKLSHYFMYYYNFRWSMYVTERSVTFQGIKFYWKL